MLVCYEPDFQVDYRRYVKAFISLSKSYLYAVIYNNIKDISIIIAVLSSKIMVYLKPSYFNTNYRSDPKIVKFNMH